MDVSGAGQSPPGVSVVCVLVLLHVLCDCPNRGCMGHR